MSLIIRNARVVSPGLLGPAGRLEITERADIAVAGGRIEAMGPGLTAPAGAAELDARGRVVLPGFVDPHTHALWAGERLGEWERKLAGATYLEILAAGGGIMSTVRSVRAATEEELTLSLRARLAVAIRCGTTTIEVKSGYGLSTEAELKMLRAIRAAAADWPGTVVPTALLGHAIDPDAPGGRDAFVERTIRETLSAVSEAFPGIAIDAYCEKGAWTVDECVRLFSAARDRGHPIRVHTDQFTDLGMVGEAVRLGARSVDHLEASSPGVAATLAGTGTAAVLLPCAGFHLDGRYAAARPLLDAGVSVALATNCNPGSAPCIAMSMAVALGVRHCGMTPAEAITAATAASAGVLGFTDRGRLSPGLRADLVVLRHTDERALAFEFGDSGVDAVVCGGRLVHSR